MKRIDPSQLATPLEVDETGAVITHADFDALARENRRRRPRKKRWAKANSRKRPRTVVSEANLPFGYVTTKALLAEANARGIAASPMALSRARARGTIEAGDFRCRGEGERGQPALTWHLETTLTALETRRAA